MLNVIMLYVVAPIMPKPQQEKNGSLEIELLKRFFKINSVLQIWVLPDLSLSQWPMSLNFFLSIQNKLECLLLESIFKLFSYLQVKPATYLTIYLYPITLFSSSLIPKRNKLECLLSLICK
jgi:hypothetical protein